MRIYLHRKFAKKLTKDLRNIVEQDKLHKTYEPKSSVLSSAIS